MVPHHKEELLSCLAYGPCDIFKKQQLTHSSTDYERWERSSNRSEYAFDLECFKNEGYEPYVVVKRTVAFMTPRFDEQYVDYGMNKLIWIFRLRLAEYRFRVLLHSFAVHVPHPSSKLSGDMLSKRNSGKMTDMDFYMKEFVDDLKSKGIELKTVLPLCEGVESSLLWSRITEFTMRYLSPFPFDALTAFIYTLATTGAVAMSIMVTRYLNIVSSNSSRKLLHISMAAVFILCWPMFPDTDEGKVYAMSIPFLFTVVFWIVGRRYVQSTIIVDAMSRTGKASELTAGPVQYGIIMTLTTFFYWKRVDAIFVILSLAFGDGFAPWFGAIKKGNKALWWNPSKTWFGLIAFAVFSALSIIGYCYYFQS
ncbi:hypothetical protein BLSTO_03071 [Blastocystis sp. subtype 1]